MHAHTHTHTTLIIIYSGVVVTIQLEDGCDMTQLGCGCDTIQSTDGGTTSMVRSITTSHDLFNNPKE